MNRTVLRLFCFGGFFWWQQSKVYCPPVKWYKLPSREGPERTATGISQSEVRSDGPRLHPSSSQVFASTRHVGKVDGYRGVWTMKIQ